MHIPSGRSPLVSVITIGYNSANSIEQTITSVIAQTYPNKEYLIIDGGSEDETIDILEQYKARIDQWISERDEGISDAMNKGLKIATGDWILFLHSDDYLVGKDSLEKAVAMIENDIDILACNIYFKYGETIKLAKPHGWNFRMNFKVGLWHQAILCRKTLFERVGRFDKSFRIGMDYDFLLRAFRQGTNVKIVDLPLSVMRKTGLSSQIDKNSMRMRFEEERRVQEKNCHSALLRATYAAYWPLYRTYNFIRGRY